MLPCHLVSHMHSALQDPASLCSAALVERAWADAILPCHLVSHMHIALYCLIVPFSLAWKSLSKGHVTVSSGVTYTCCIAGSGVIVPIGSGEEVQHISAEGAGVAAGCTTRHSAEVSL